MTSTQTCPCCGFAGLDRRPYANLTDAASAIGHTPPYYTIFGDPSYNVCDCCGFEFGNDDNPGTGRPVSFEEYRAEWISDGCPWFSPEQRPARWNLHEQLVKAGLVEGQ